MFKYPFSIEPWRIPMYIRNRPRFYLSWAGQSIIIYTRSELAHSTVLRACFDWLCFFVPRKARFCYNLLSYKSLGRFAPPTNWLCFFKSLLSINTRFLLRHWIFDIGYSLTVFYILHSLYTKYKTIYTILLCIILNIIPRINQFLKKSPWDGVLYLVLIVEYRILV